MLRVEGLTAGYGAGAVLRDVSLAVGEGEFVAVVGPNGAGKTTLFKCISGIVPLESGRITFEGRDITRLAPHRRPHLGIAHVPEGRQVFPGLSVMENLEMGAYTAAGRAAWATNLERILSWFPVLAERRAQPAGTLSGGEQQMLAIGRGLASSPRLLMLDEPSMGLSPAIADDIFERLIDIHKTAGVALLLVEQRVAEALTFAERGCVLEAGKIVLEGPAEALMRSDRIARAYLGL